MCHPVVDLRTAKKESEMPVEEIVSNIDEAGLSKSVSMASMVSMNSRTDLLPSDPSIGPLPEVNTSSRRYRIKQKIIGTKDRTVERSKRLLKFVTSKRFLHEALRTATALVVFTTVTSLMMMAQIASDEWFDNYSKRLVLANSKIQVKSGFRDVFAVDPLHDRLFEIIPDWQHLRRSLPDVLLTTYVIAFFLFNVIWVHRKRIQYQGVVVLRRFLWIMSVLYLFRMMTFMVTTVPNPIHNCVPKYADTTDFEAYISLIRDMASGKVSACTDNIYSGHTTLTIVILFSFWMYSGLLILQLYAIVHAFLIISAILITRLHYTIDVLIAMFMSAFVFLTFHFLLTVMLDDKLLEKNLNGPSDQDTSVLISERRTLHRVYKDLINRAIWWMDGFDLRLSSTVPAGDEMAEAGIAEEFTEEIVSPSIKDPISPTAYQV